MNMLISSTVVGRCMLELNIMISPTYKTTYIAMAHVQNVHCVPIKIFMSHRPLRSFISALKAVKADIWTKHERVHVSRPKLPGDN